MSELGTQLRELIESKAPPLDLAQLVESPIRERRSRRRPILAAVGLTVLVVLLGTAFRALIEDVPPVPIIAPVPPAPAEPTPPPTVEAGSRLAWDLVDPGLDGRWTLIDAGDRFVVVDGGGELRASVDGREWTTLTGALEGAYFAAWQGTVLSWAPGTWTPGRVGLRLADGTVEGWSVPGVLDGAVGPDGVVVVARLSADQATRAFGQQIERASDAWYTPDGQRWYPVEGYPSGLSESTIVGTPSGFYAAPRQGSAIWHSADGRSWRPLREEDVRSERFGSWRQLARYREGAILMSYIDPDELVFEDLTPAGAEHLFDVGLAVDLAPHLRLAAGPFGIVAVDPGGGHVVYSATGNDVRTGPLPDAFVQELARSELVMTARAILLVMDDPTGPGDGMSGRAWAMARPVPPDHRP